MNRYPVKILAIGAGGLQRALTHQFVDDLNKNNLYHGGIYIGQPRGSEKAEAFNQQDGIYHVVTFDLNGIKAIKQIESVVGATTLATTEGQERFYSQTAKQLDLILVGVTEAGIAKGEIAMDILHQTLSRYHAHHGSKSTISVINTDNIRNNGHTLREIIVNDYPTSSSQVTEWLKNQVDFLDQMGDRIVPQSDAVPITIREEAISQIDRPDRLITYTESLPLISLVLQDPHRRLRLPFEKLEKFGVIVSQASIDPFHDWKLLLVNAVHVPGITHKGFLSGIETVNEVSTHPLFGPHLERLMSGYADVVSQDIPILGRQALDYTMDFVRRIREIEDSNARINVNETVKLRERASDIIVSANYHTTTTQFRSEFAYSFATVLRFLTPIERNGDTYIGQTDLGKRYEIADPNRFIQDALIGAFGQEDVGKRLRRIMAQTELWTMPGSAFPVDLSRNSDFVDRLIPLYRQLVNGRTCLQLLAEIQNVRQD